MDKKEANMWCGILAGWYFFGRKRKNGEKQGSVIGGIASIIIYIIVIKGAYEYIGDGFAFFISLPLIIGVIIGLIRAIAVTVALRAQKLENNNNDNEEKQ